MARQVIHIFGASGSGTSTIGRYISEKANCYFMDTDDYYWKPTNPPYTAKRQIPERIDLIRADIDKHDNVVISGSLVNWGDILIPLFTLAIRVETDTAVRIERLKKREREHFGSRIDVGGDMYETHRAFLEWASGYDHGGLDTRSKAKHDDWQKKLLCPLITVDGTMSLEKIYETIKGNL